MTFRLLHIDCDFNGVASTVGRYRAMGVAADFLTDPARFRFVEARSERQVRQVVADAAEWRPDAVFVDGAAPLVTLFGGNNNDGDEYARVYREVIHAFADLGALVVVTDNLAKTGLESGYASGTTKKRDLADGVYYGVRLMEPFRPGVGGSAAMRVLKDRFGAVEAVAKVDPKGGPSLATVFRMDSRGDDITWEFWAPSETDADPITDKAAADADALEQLDPPPKSKNDVKTRMGWGSDRAYAAFKTFGERRESQRVTFPLDPHPTEKDN